MMKTLVLCVDRDDDLGEKANITSPIIGRKDNLRAAIALGITDPEDSDTNSVFAAIKIYDSLIDHNEDAEIATVCGHKIVGRKSDTIIMDQFNTLLKVIKPTHVILVTDGQEDEFIEPVITSKVPIRNVHRVTVKQAKDVESLVYTILKAVQNEKILKKVVLPVSLVLITYGILALLNLTHIAIGAIALVVGGYLFVRAFHMEEPLTKVMQEMGSSMERRRYIALITWAVSISLFIIGIAIGAFQADAEYNGSGTKYIYIFTYYAAGFLVTAGIVYVLGSAIDLYVRKKRTPRYTGTFLGSLFAILFGIYAALEVLEYVEYDRSLDIKSMIIFGILFAVSLFMAVVFHTYQNIITARGQKKSGWRR